MKTRHKHSTKSLEAGLLGLLLAVACTEAPAPAPLPGSAASTQLAVSGAVSSAPSSVASVAASSAASGPAQANSAPAASNAAGNAPMECPEGQVKVEGGAFWVGTSGTKGLPDEHPRFVTRVPSLCVDRTEVTVRAFTQCVEAGKCDAKPRPRLTCNYGRPERQDHPMNCVTWEQADTYCKAQGARLPTEVEWEYLARGGAEYRKYSWGDEEPDGRTCWKRAFSCPVMSYPAGAFGLFDVIGNVWEWTQSNHGDYPWPARESPHKVYRGGGWSRRFDKWLQPTLRNRDVPEAMGSHLGLRCVSLLPGSRCPYLAVGADAAAVSGTDTCLAGVDEVECAKGKSWNGLRCARPGEPECPNGTTAQPGFGCQVPYSGAAHPSSHPAGETAPPLVPSQKRTPEFDGDCLQFQPNRPKAYRLEGATHKDRTAYGSAQGCKNRDVGASWNSICCP